MNITSAARCASRMRPRVLSGSRLRPHQRASRTPQPSPRTSPFRTPRTQSFSVLSPRQNTAPQNPPPGAPRPPHQGPVPRRASQWKTWVLFNLAGLSAVVMFAVVLKNAPADGRAAINASSFSPFTITAREQVSPTAFVVSVRAGDAEAPEGRALAAPLTDAWAHGVWSVEAKQPQLQIARHYTPLPPASGGDGGDGVLRFLIRRLDGGEMSTYLSKLQVGEQVYLRGPHLGFDVERRLGEAENVVFLAGGTGIAPALQVARRLLDSKIPGQDKPRVSILWANRRGADALGRQQTPGASGAVQGWMKSLQWNTPDLKKRREVKEQAQKDEPSLARQLREMQERHPDHFRIAYFVDEEGSFISPEDLHAALSSPPSPSSIPSSSSSSPPPTQQTPLLPPASTCPWHSPSILTRLPDADDMSRRTIHCTCARAAKSAVAATGARPGANLVCVSGPDGFVGAYAGPKRWYAGKEMQGLVDGVLKGVLEEREKEAGSGKGRENWMVLKL
ncbi:hypothetical protein F4781DRAFT_350104 [Annulohypoxylon bovei var. microspora]|nr:hypothetical protein F4781DRAFT_350104 [Annulohypoxylon bovei var. microspora]